MTTDKTEKRLLPQNKEIVMTGNLRCASALVLLIASVNISAKETMIRCDVTGKATYNIPALNSRSDDPVARHYVYDDTEKSLSIILDGERRPACPEENCTLRVSKTMIAWTWKSPNSTTKTMIDRLTGKLSESVEMSSGNLNGFMEYKGPCRQETLDERKF